MKSSNRIRIWDARSRVCRRSIDVVSDIGRLLWSKDGQTFLYSEPGNIKVIDTASGDTTRTIKTDECVSFAYSPKGGYLAFRDRDQLHILDSNSLTEKLTMQGPKSGFFTFDWSPDERFILIDGQGTVAVLDTTTGKAVGFNSFPDLSRARWAPDGKSLILGILNSAPKFVPVNLSSQDSGSSIFEGGKVGAPGWGNYPCPVNVEDCFAAFDKSLTAEQRERFKRTKEGDLFKFGGGSAILDSLMSDVYHRWDHFELQNFFQQKGITDPRDMFGIVLHCYWRHLNEKPLDLDKQVQERRSWWQRQGLLWKKTGHFGDGRVKFRLNGFDREFTEKALEHEIKEALKISN